MFTHNTKNRTNTEKNKRLDKKILKTQLTPTKRQLNNKIK